MRRPSRCRMTASIPCRRGRRSRSGSVVGGHGERAARCGGPGGCALRARQRARDGAARGQPDGDLLRALRARVRARALARGNDVVLSRSSPARLRARRSGAEGGDPGPRVARDRLGRPGWGLCGGRGGVRPALPERPGRALGAGRGLRAQLPTDGHGAGARPRCRDRRPRRAGGRRGPRAPASRRVRPPGRFASVPRRSS